MHRRRIVWRRKHSEQTKTKQGRTLSRR